MTNGPPAWPRALNLDASETLMLDPNLTKQTGGMLPLAARDFFGAAPGAARLASPDLAPLTTPETRSGGRFRQLLGSAKELKPLADVDRISGTRRGASQLSQHDAITQQAQKWVAQTFYGTLMKQMHDSPFKSELFSGGRGAQAFQPLMDQHLIDHMAHSSSQKLVRGIVRQIEGRAAYRKQAKAQKTVDETPETPVNFDAMNAAKQVTSQDKEPADFSRPDSQRNGRTRVAPGLRA